MSTPEDLFGQSIDANRQLKEVVEAKVGEYDEKVNALNALATNKMSQMEQDLAAWKQQASDSLDDMFKSSNHIYPDQLENGLSGIQAELKQGKLNVVHLTAGETYVLESGIRAYSCGLMFVGDGVNTERSNLPIITTTTTTYDSSSDISYNSLKAEISLESGSNIRFQNCLISLPEKADDSLPWSNRNSLINIANTYSGTGDVSLHNVNLNVTTGTGLVRNHVGGNISVGWYSGIISGPGYISSNNNRNGTVRLALYGVGFENNAKALTIGGVIGENVLSNYTGEHLQ